MKTILRFIVFSVLILLQNVVIHAQTNFKMGGAAGQLDIRYNANGTYQIYKGYPGGSGNIDIKLPLSKPDNKGIRDYSQLYVSETSESTTNALGKPVFAIMTGSNISESVSSINAISITDVASNNTGTRQERTKIFVFTKNYEVSVTLKLIYDTSNPKFLIKETTLDLTKVPKDTLTSLAYGFDSYINGCDAAAALVLPDLGFNGVANTLDRIYSNAIISGLKFVGAQNTKGEGSMMGFFPMGGHKFNRAYSGSVSGYQESIDFLKIPQDNSIFKFGKYAIDNSYCNAFFTPWDNSLGVVYDNIPGDQIVTIRTGLTFTETLTGDLDYEWITSNNTPAVNVKVKDQVTLKLTYHSYSLAQLDSIGFRVNFPGLTQLGGCVIDKFTNVSQVCAVGNQYYELKSASMANQTGTITIPVDVNRAGQWTIDANSIQKPKNVLPFGSPATLTAKTTVSLLGGDATICGGNNEQEYTVKLKDKAIDDVTVSIEYSGETGNFSIRPNTVVIPADKDSVTFKIKTVASPNGSPMVIKLKETDRVYVDVAPSSGSFSVTAYGTLGYNTFTHGNDSVCYSENPGAMSVSGVSGGSGLYTYEWQSSTQNGVWNTVQKVVNTRDKNNVYNPGILQKTTQYRCIITGNVCQGSITVPSSSIPYTVTVIPLPVLSVIPDIVVDVEQTVSAINLSGQNIATVEWTNDDERIGLAKSGTGNIPAFTSKNPTLSPIVGNIKVTPMSVSGKCSGKPFIFSITVNPVGLLNDSASVQEYKSVLIDVLKNDNIPSNPEFKIIEQPVAGTVDVIGSGKDSKVVYNHTGYRNSDMQAAELINNIDSFKYSITSGSTSKTAMVYVYVLQSANGGFAFCSAKEETVIMKAPSNHALFFFSDKEGKNQMIPDAANTYKVKAPFTYYVMPFVIGASGAFPIAGLEITELGNINTPATMRWTGLVNNEWNNPSNWVMVNNGFESPAYYSPSLCSNVIISSTATKFPELTDSAYCNNIKIEDRAMLKNPHVLRYNSASVDFRLRPSELERFIMWSAPLKDMYSGDYHYYSNKSTNPSFGDVFMNYFQKKKLNVSETVKNGLTATFKETNESLPLGKSFNLKVTQTTVTRDSFMHFPAKEKEYATGQNLQRTYKDRFITDGISLNTSDSTFNLPVNMAGESNAGFDIIQVVNPYLAYLKVSEFIAGNRFLEGGYYVWNGEVSSGFTSNIELNGNRFVSTGFQLNDPGLIPPLQSFFVKKTKSGDDINSLKMSPKWTTTISPSGSGKYLLRAATVENGGVLNINVSQGKKEAHAALVYAPGTTNFIDSDDMPVLVFDELPLSVYTYSITNIPLSINNSSTFDMMPISLGMHVRHAGETKLRFEGLETFGYNVKLIDKLLNKEVDLMSNPTYIFTVARPNHGGFIEINDRFDLRMSFTGNGLIYTDNENTTATTLQIAGGKGHIYVKSNGNPVESIHVYDSGGRLVYSATNIADHQHNIYLNGQNVYMVIAKAGEDVKTSKAYVK